jgi:two-component system, NtrC family, sensor kinase
MKNTTFFLLCFLQVSLVYGQSNLKLDSLKNELVKAKNDTTKVMIYANFALLGYSVPRQDKIGFAQKGYDLARKIHFDKGIIKCGQNLGFLMSAKDYFKALPILFFVKDLCEKNMDTTNLAITYGIIAMAHNAFDKPKSIYYCRICLKLMKKAKLSDDAFPINTSMGMAFKENGNLDSALIYLNKGYQISLKGISVFNVKFYDLQFGQINYAKGNIDLALQFLKKAIVNTNGGTVGEAFYYLAKIYKDQNKLDSATYFAKQSLMYEQKYERNINIINSSQILYELYKNSNSKEALHYLEISSMTKDSLFNQEKARQVEKLAFEEQEREARTQRRIEAHETEVQNTIKIYILSGVLLALGIFSFILYRNNKNKHRANILLHSQKEEIDLQREKAEKAFIELKATQNQLIQAEKMASLGELTAGIAHEIQNPLNFVNNFSEMSVELAQELNEEIDKNLMDKDLVKEILSDLTQNQQKINHHGKRASSIVKGMLEHSRTSTGAKELTDINKLADEYLRLSYHGLRAKDKNGSTLRFNSNFKTDFDENLPKIEIIPQDFGRVLLNLINNAFYACAERSRSAVSNHGHVETGNALSLQSQYHPIVTISTEQSENQLIIKIKDNGTGMSEATKAKIFQPFFTTKPTGQGTGLGLSLAYDIITKGHGGTLEVETKEEEGTTFIIKIPYI